MEQIYTHPENFTLESGEQLENLAINYHQYGKPNASQSNVIWVFHPLTSNSDVETWWPGLFGVDAIFDVNKHCVICANTICSPYGTTAPSDLAFPAISLRDIVNAHIKLADYLGIRRIKTAIGGSFGGAQALEFAYAFDGHIDQLVVMACLAKETAWGVALHEAQRMALKADASFGDKGKGKEGLKAARAIGLMTYRTAEGFIQSQTGQNEQGEFKANTYLQYQGDKFVNRFDSLAYYYLSHCLDSHDIGRGRGGVDVALGKLRMPTLIIGIPNDLLIPIGEVKMMAEAIPRATLVTLNSIYGHDGFLIESEKISSMLLEFTAENTKKICCAHAV